MFRSSLFALTVALFAALQSPAQTYTTTKPIDVGDGVTNMFLIQGFISPEAGTSTVRITAYDDNNQVIFDDFAEADEYYYWEILVTCDYSSSVISPYTMVAGATLSMVAYWETENIGDVEEQEIEVLDPFWLLNSPFYTTGPRGFVSSGFTVTGKGYLDWGYEWDNGEWTLIFDDNNSVIGTGNFHGDDGLHSFSFMVSCGISTSGWYRIECTTTDRNTNQGYYTYRYIYINAD